MVSYPRFLAMDSMDSIRDSFSPCGWISWINRTLFSVYDWKIDDCGCERVRAAIVDQTEKYIIVPDIFSGISRAFIGKQEAQAAFGLCSRRVVSVHVLHLLV